MKLVGRSDLRQQFRRYRQAVGWLYAELFRFRPGRTTLAIMMNVGGKTLRGGALSLIIYYANLMESAGTAELLGYTFATRDETTFISMIAATGVLLLISAGMIFLGNRETLRTAIDFAIYSSRRTFALNTPRPPQNAPPRTESYPAKIIGRATGIVGIARGVRPLLQLSNPATTLLYSTAVLLYVDAILTVAMVVLIGPTIALQYVINYHATQNDKRMGAARTRMQRNIQSEFDELSWAPQLHPSERARLAGEYTREEIDELPRRYFFRTIAPSYSGLVSDVVIATAVAIITMRLGTQALSGAIAWSFFLGYIIFARLLLSSLRGVLVTITGFARHYPRIQNLRQLLTSSAHSARFNATEMQIVGRETNLTGDRERVRLQRGSPFAVVTPVPVTRFNLYAFIDAITGRRASSNAALRRASFTVPNALRTAPGGSVRELLGLPDDADHAQVIDCLTHLDEEAESILSGQGQMQDGIEWESLSIQLRARILLDQAARSPADLVLIDDLILRRSGRRFARDLLARLSDRFIVVRYSPGTKEIGWDETHVGALAADRSFSLMTSQWYRDHAEEVMQWLGGHQSQADDDDTEFEDDD